MIGAKAVLGKAFNTTRKGSNILANDFDNQRMMAIINPKSVPINNPKEVSSKDIPISFQMVPSPKYLINSLNIALGLLTKNSFNILKLTSISHNSKIKTNNQK